MWTWGHRGSFLWSVDAACQGDGSQEEEGGKAGPEAAFAHFSRTIAPLLPREAAV